MKNLIFLFLISVAISCNNPEKKDAAGTAVNNAKALYEKNLASLKKGSQLLKIKKLMNGLLRLLILPFGILQCMAPRLQQK